MSPEELQKLHDQMVTMSALSAEIALYIQSGLVDYDNIDQEWIDGFGEKMQFLNTASISMLTTMIGAEAVTAVYKTIEGAM